MILGEPIPTENRHINIFEQFVVDNEIYVDEDYWYEMIDDYSEEFIIRELSDAIVEYGIKLPYREITLDDVEADYEALLEKNDLIQDGKWGSKFDYKYDFMDKYVGISNIGNKASDYFHQVQRWKCDATGYPSPQKTWDTERFRLTLFKALFSLKVTEINPTVLRNIISLRKYIAAQFRPSAAKAIYDWFEAETVLDFSMGWGDRILGAHASKYVKRYLGIDPSWELFMNYFNQINHYNLIGDAKRYSIRPACAEDPTIQFFNKDRDYKYAEVDLVFTSPPYYDKEKYDQSENQSYIKYKKFEDWMNNFLFKSIELRTANLKSGGHLVINISDIYTRKKRYNICDNMNDYIASTGQFEYVGAMGLRMPKRPMSKSFDTVGVYGEPIWIWKKK